MSVRGKASKETEQKSVPDLGHDQWKEKPRFSIIAGSKISSTLSEDYTLWELPSYSGKTG